MPAIPPIRGGSRARDPLAEAALPVLLHRLNNATQILSSLNSLIALGADGRALFETRAGDLAYASARVDELGWCLAVAASALGADLLLARRERAGLGPLVDLAGETLRREGRALARPATALPTLHGDVAHGWELPWLAATWLYVSGCALPEGSTLGWQFSSSGDRATFACRAPWTAAHEAARDAWRNVLSDARFERTSCDGSECASLSVPVTWFAQ